MSNLSQFVFQENQVRVLILDEQPWFVAVDVAKVLDYVDPSMMLKHVDEEDKQVVNPHRLDSVKITESFDSNTFKVSIINESGLYAVIFGSTKSEAKAFKKWVTSEVLPAIRKTGKYEVDPVTNEIELLIQSAQQLLKIRQEQERIKLEQQIQAQKLAEIETLTHQHDSEIDRIFNPNGHYFSIMGYYNRHNLGAISVHDAAIIGKKVSAYCRANGILITPMSDPRFGWVNTYPEDVIALFVENHPASIEFNDQQITKTLQRYVKVILEAM